MTPIAPPSRADEHRACGRGAAMRLEPPRAISGEHSAALLEQPVVAEQHVRAVDRAPRAPRPGQRLKRRSPATASSPSALARVDDRARRSDARSACSSDAAASAARRRRRRRRAARTSTTCSCPVVSVPVLSNATQRTAASRSRCAPPLISTPLRAARGQRRRRSTPASRSPARTGRRSPAAPARDRSRCPSAPPAAAAARPRPPPRARAPPACRSARSARRTSGRRALRLRPLDQMDDARERRVARAAA